MEQRIAIITKNKNTYSETFIRAQIEFIPYQLLMYGDWLPSHYNDGVMIQNRLKNYVSRVIKKVFGLSIFTREHEISKLLNRYKINLVLAQYGPSGVEIIDSCKKLKIPLIVHFHGFDASQLDTLQKYKVGYLRLFKFARCIIAVSNSMSEKLVDLGCPREKIRVIHYGPNEIFLTNKPSYISQSFFSIGRFVEKKAPYLTILSFYLVLQEYKDAKLFFAGDGELLGVCKSLVKALGLEQNVKFLGILNQDEARFYLEKSLAYVQHSIVAETGDSEGTPVAIIEAQASALPVISTIHAGIPDIVLNGKTGILVEEHDIFGMAVAMKKIIHDQSLARKLGQKGRQRIIENFTMKHYLDKLIKVIEDVK